jgi:hypothetical protein
MVATSAMKSWRVAISRYTIALAERNLAIAGARVSAGCAAF